jgi:hypothetical protein
VEQSVLLRLGRCVQTIVGQLTSVPFLRFIPQEVSVLCRICNCVLLENPKVTRCQKCHKGTLRASGTFGTSLVSVFGVFHALLCERLELEAEPAAVEECREALVAHWQRILERGA